MPLFAQLGPEYYDENNKGILSRMQAAYAESITINQSFWSEADLDTRFEAGDQNLYSDIYGNVPINRRRQFSFNHIRPIINMVSGWQNRNRKSTIVVPIENANEETADDLTKVLMWCNRQEGILETISECFHGSLVTGMNLLQVWVDYRQDPVSGNIKVDNCPYNSFLIDPFFRKADLSDCNFIWKRSFITKREAISLLPDKTEDIIGLQGNSNGSAKDPKFQYMPETYNYGMKNLLSYDEYYYRDFREQKMLVDTETGETQEWRSQNDDGLKDFLATYPQITVVKQIIPTVRLAIVLQGRVMYDGPNLTGDLYPFVPVFAYYRPQMPYFPWRIQGIVRSLRDPQYLYNRRRTTEMDILESQINSGWIYKENALVNPSDVFMSGQGRGLALKEEAQMTDVQQIQAPNIPPGMFQVSENLNKEMFDVSGANEALMGSAIDDKAGILEMLRQGAGLTGLQGLFDNLDRAQKLLGKIMINIIQQNFTPGKVAKILEKDATPEFYSKNFGRYDAAVEEGLNTTTQRQMQFAQMLQLYEYKIITPEDLLDAATIQNKKTIVENAKKAQEQATQAQQQQEQVQMAELQSRTDLAHARAEADRGLGAERYSRIEENKALAVEREAAAVKDEQQALLNLVKAIKEIDTIDLDHITKIMSLKQMINNEEAIAAGKVNSSTEVKPSPIDQVDKIQRAVQ